MNNLYEKEYGCEVSCLPVHRGGQSYFSSIECNEFNKNKILLSAYISCYNFYHLNC